MLITIDKYIKYLYL